MRTPDQTLLVRALNSTKQSYFPTYVGLRLLGKDLPTDSQNYLQRLLERRLNSGDRWSYKTFKLYKGSKALDGKQEYEYRDCVAPSPLTAIAGALVLGVLAKNPAFSISPRVYSYRWPATSNSGSSYKFFAEGYKARNNDIFSKLQGSDRVAVVTDIKRFYPSVDSHQIKTGLHNFLHLMPAGKEKDGISNFFSQLLSAGSGGIPIGPAPGHLLGHVALAKVDQQLEKKYGSSYFRYVDDIVIVCEKIDQKSVQADIKACIESSNFELNSSKTELLTQEAWQINMLRLDVPAGDDFRSLTRDISIYLALYPSRVSALANHFLNAGLSIPVNRLKTLASYSPFRYFVRRWNKSTGVMRTLHILTLDLNYFLQRALTLKRLYEESLNEICRESVNSPLSHRWNVQRARRVVNTLFYLRSFSEWKIKEDIFSLFPELIEQAALASALRDGVVNPILPFFGQAPAAFAELWHEHGDGLAILRPEHNLDEPKISSLVLLRLHGVIKESDLPPVSEGIDQRLLLATNDLTPASRTSPDLSFDDEFESLRLGTTGKDISELARTRHSISEGSPLEALSLFGSEYLS